MKKSTTTTKLFSTLSLLIAPNFLILNLRPISGFVAPVVVVRGGHRREATFSSSPSSSSSNKWLSSTTITSPLQPPMIDENNDDDQDDTTTKQYYGKRKCITQTTTTTKTTKPSKYLIHRGRSGSMIKRSPSIAGIGLCRGWNDDATHAFTNAVQKLVKLNPILAGQIYESNRCGRSELRIIESSGTPTFDNNSESSEKNPFVKILHPPNSQKLLNDFSSDDYNHNNNPNKILEAVKEHCFPLLEESELTSDQIKKHLPLFTTTIIILPNNHAVYAMKLSHAVGDGVTFMMLLKQLSLLMSGKDLPPPIDWDHPQKATHELYPKHFSSHDIECMYGAPFLLGCVKNIFKQEILKQDEAQRTSHVLLFDKNKVNQKKKRLRAELNCPELSSNDIITTALCQSNVSSDMFVFTENVRVNGGGSNNNGIPNNAAGNFLVEIPVSRQTASNPDQLRHAVVEMQQRQQQQQCNQESVTSPSEGRRKKPLPTKPFLDGKVARITSLATIPATLVYDGTEQLCTVPYMSFLSKLPLDTALIFRFNTQYWGVLHNFAKLEPSPLLKELLWNNDDEKAKDLKTCKTNEKAKDDCGKNEIFYLPRGPSFSN